jgi:hypothetical protein
VSDGDLQRRVDRLERTVSDPAVGLERRVTAVETTGKTLVGIGYAALSMIGLILAAVVYFRI